MSIRMDKSAREICELASARLRFTQSDKALCLVEVKSNGEKIIFSLTEISISTMLGLSSKLYVVYRDEIDSLPIGEESFSAVDCRLLLIDGVADSAEFALHLPLRQIG
ncbi:hypothetical protein WR25_10999 [Diploscapter pachys]|uniref:Ras-associating domain-containing protein n=1 Tax=Diploscapter pachys TaxID=2018661 RepID=A0A2A2LRE5_9BILA|nr:hypothetical protein WR25_10999 [Diploscapter pachys]